jgi:transcriptional/translational regulatory protein YebC/TACO1
MYTIRLRVHDKVYEKLMWLLEKFSKEELQVIRENDDFLSVKEYLQQELLQIEEDKVEYLNLDQLESDLESSIKKYED